MSLKVHCSTGSVVIGETMVISFRATLAAKEVKFRWVRRRMKVIRPFIKASWN
jgi:hypothetical protein